MAARVAQEAVEVMTEQIQLARSSQVVAEAGASSVGNARAAQVATEAGVVGLTAPTGRASQLAVEVLTRRP